MPCAPCPHQHPPDTPRGSFLGGLCQGCLCHPAAPWSRLAGSPRSPGSRLPGSALGPFVTLRCPRPAPRGLACRGRGRDRLSVPAPLSFSPPTACRLPRRPPLPPPPDTPPATLSPPRGHAWLGGRRAPDPPVPLNASRHPPPAAPGARGPRPPPPARRCAALCGGARGAAGGQATPPPLFPGMRPPCPAPPCPHQHPPDTPRGSFLGGLCQGCLCHPAAPWSRLAGSPRSPGSRLPGSALGPFVTLRCPRPAPRGLACRGRGRDRLSVPAPLSFSPPTACRLPRRPPLPPPPDTPPATLSPPRGHAWLGGRRAPDPPVPLNASRHPPPAAPGARGPRPPPPARRCAALCGGARGAAGGQATPPPLFPGMRPPCPAPPCPHQHPPDTPRGSFLGGLCQGCLCHPAAPWSRLAGSPRSPGSRLPGSALGPFVTLRCPRPAPRGLACRGRGRDRLSVPAPLSFSPPTACRLPRRPPLPPPPDTPPATLSPPRGHAWLGGRRAPDPPVPLNASRHPPPAAPGARGPRPPPPARRCAALCGGARGAAGGQATPPPLFPGMRPPCPAPASRSDFPRLPHDTCTAHTLFAGIRHLILKFPYPPSAASSPADP